MVVAVEDPAEAALAVVAVAAAVAAADRVRRRTGRGRVQDLDQGWAPVSSGLEPVPGLARSRNLRDRQQPRPPLSKIRDRRRVRGRDFRYPRGLVSQLAPLRHRVHPRVRPARRPLVRLPNLNRPNSPRYPVPDLRSLRRPTTPWIPRPVLHLRRN